VRLAVVLLLVLINGCSNVQPIVYQPPRAMTYQELKAIELRYRDCPQMDSIIDRMRQQLVLRGLENKNPEDLDEADRLYNNRVKIIIWSLLIACHNPNRYKK